MRYYLESILKGFRPENSIVILEAKARKTPNFLIIDVDQDDMPEILFAYRNLGEKYIGILKRQDMKWQLHKIMLERNQKASGLGHLLNTLQDVTFTSRDVGTTVAMETVLGHYEPVFISYVEGTLSHGFIQKEEKDEPTVKTQLREAPFTVSNLPEESTMLEKEIIDFKQADVTGNGEQESIYLIGDRPFKDEQGYVENLMLRVRAANKTIEIPLANDKGYNPALFLGDFTGDGVSEILINIYSSGVGGYIYSYIFSFLEDKPQVLFDSDNFNEEYTGEVTYNDNYRVTVQTDRPSKQYKIDISEKDDDYLETLYNENGKLKEPTVGNLLGLIALYPTDYDLNSQYNLSAIQRITGLSNIDTIGLIQTFLKWQAATNRFEPIIQYVSVLGEPV